MSQLPVVDLQGDVETQRRNVLEGLTGPGFLYIDGVTGYDADELHRLCDWFFG